eukprot:3116617-Rhodomonas_salina.1
MGSARLELSLSAVPTLDRAPQYLRNPRPRQKHRCTTHWRINIICAIWINVRRGSTDAQPTPTASVHSAATSEAVMHKGQRQRVMMIMRRGIRVSLRGSDAQRASADCASVLFASTASAALIRLKDRQHLCHPGGVNVSGTDCTTNTMHNKHPQLLSHAQSHADQ